MSFQLSPESLIFSLQSQIPSLQLQITDLENAIVEIPEIRFKTIEVKNPQGFFSGQTRQVAIRRTNTEIGLIRGNAEVSIKIKELNQRISRINLQINVLEKETQIREIEGIDGQKINGQKDNTLRNALLIGGALLIL